MMVQLSIIIPVYNAEKTILKTLNSIKKEVNDNIEVIIINDGSMDQSEQIIAEYINSLSNFKLISIPNAGVSHARNLGVKNARGKYVTFIDADDLYVDDAIIRMYKDVLSISDYDMLIYSYENISSKKRRTIAMSDKTYQVVGNSNLFEWLVYNELINAVWNKVYKKSIIENYGVFFPENIDIGEDLMFNLSYIKNCKVIRTLDFKTIFHFFKHNEGLVSKFRIDRLDISMNILDYIRRTADNLELQQNNINTLCTKLLVKDIFAYFMDFNKKSCNLTYNEKLKIIKSIINDDVIRSKLLISNKLGYLKILSFLLKTRNPYLIYFCSNILCLKRYIF